MEFIHKLQWLKAKYYVHSYEWSINEFKRIPDNKNKLKVETSKLELKNYLYILETEHHYKLQRHKKTEKLYDHCFSFFNDSEVFRPCTQLIQAFKDEIEKQRKTD